MNTHQALSFAYATGPAGGGEEQKDHQPRLRFADRQQLLPSMTIDGLLPGDHEARLVWQLIQHLDLTPLHAGIRSVQGRPGRPATDPRILTALWLYAALEGIASARAVELLCTDHPAFRWLC